MHPFQRRQQRWTWFAVVVLTILAVVSGLPLAGPVAVGGQGIQLELEVFAVGFSQPVKIANAGDERLFVVEQQGIIYILDAQGARLPTPFIDLTDRVELDDERGLLGLTFTPGDRTTFYVNYTRKSNVNAERGDTVIARYHTLAADLNQGDPDSEEIVLVIDQPYANHNAGDLAFGPDGFLYIPMGDGGSGGDPEDRAQNLNELLGKVLRLDVVGQATYAIPPGNPFADDNNPNTRAEIWSYGWRNPWRFSFDRVTGDMYLGDVGQTAREEVDFEPANTPGRNYGWNQCEGSIAYPPQDPPQPCPNTSGLTPPIFDYGRGEGTTVTGGFVYRGSQYTNLVGHYIFADFGSDRFWSLVRDGQGNWNATPHGPLGASNPSTFGENQNGELFVASHGGTIYRIKDASAPPVTETPTPTPTLVTLTPPALTPQRYLPLVHNQQ
jgi:glucose/arabinose dehydrogenase